MPNLLRPLIPWMSWLFNMLATSSYPGWIKSPHVVTLGILKMSDLDSLTIFIGGGVFQSKLWSSQIWSFPKWGGGLSGLQFQKGAFWKIWTKIYCSARNLLVHHSSLSHTTYVETKNRSYLNIYFTNYRKTARMCAKSSAPAHSMNKLTL